MFKKTLVLLFALLLSATVALAGDAPRRPVASLHDLPSEWAGVGGGLTESYAASLGIEKIVRVVKRDETPVSLEAVYDVVGSMHFGKRRLEVTQVTLMRHSVSGNTSELLIRFNDPLVKAVLGLVAYDEASDTFQLNAPFERGERRFALSAKAK